MDEVLPHHRAAVARGAKCLQCPLYNCGQGPVMGVVRPGATLTIVGEAPGTTEVEQGRPFVGASGEVLNEALREGGLSRDDCTVTNAILCRPPGGHMLGYLQELTLHHKKAVAKAKAAKQPHPVLVTPQDCCAPRLHRDVLDSGSKVLLALGSEALKALAHEMRLPFGHAKAPPGTPRVASIKKQHGSPVLAPDGRILMSALHPAFAMHGSSTYMPVIRADIERATRIAQRGGQIEWAEPEFILKPSADTCINVMRLIEQSGALVTVDIETNSANVLTADIRCVGLGAVVDGRELVIVVPLKHMDGRPWWRPGDQQLVSHGLTALLEKNPLAGHNLLFDTAVLLQRGLMKNRGKRWFDTMVAHHDTNHSELPHDLGFVAARFFEAPRWKEDADAKAVDGVDDYWLHLYCAKDVLGEMRLVGALADRVTVDGTINAFKTDTALAPVARDMGILGLHIDEPTRLKFFHTLDKAGDERAAQIRAITGDPDFNPNAFKQVSKYLYVTKGLSPPYATDGREWEELADDEEMPLDTDDPEVILAKAATNELSLLRLLELGVDDHTRQFVETLLSYRGIQKCKSTYVGLKYEEDDAGVRTVVDTHRRRGFMQTEAWGGLQNLSILHASWKIHITPTGRWATSPNVQNWPERVVYDTDLYKRTDGKDGIINTRAMVTAPPGYVLVGADYAAVELRLYAVMAQDALLIDAINNGKDPHSLNYATMMARYPGDLDKWYKRVKDADPKVKKYLRNIAKRFCIAEGEPVLVRRAGITLEVPIEKVEASDYVWDGLEWVVHDGVIDQGVKEVIYHDGLWATADHEVWVEDGRCIQHGEAAAAGLRLARTSEGGRPLRFVGSHDSASAGGQVPDDYGALPQVRHGEESGAGQPQGREVEGLPEVLPPAGRAAEVVVRAHERSTPTLHEPQERGVGTVRGSGHRVSLRLSEGCDGVGADRTEPQQGLAARPGGQQRALRAGELALRGRPHQQHEQVEHEAAPRLDVQAGGVALRGEARQEAAVRGPESGAGAGTREEVTVAPRARMVRVYDILNAGPRRRFTVSGRLAHNCFLVIYGGQKDKLYKTMAADRNPDGTRAFPDLKPGDVEMWFDNWHKGHPETKRWHEAVVRAWSSHGFVASIIDGRRRFFIGGLDPTAMPNMTIQGSAAAIANRAMIRIAEACPHRGWGELAGPVLQVHDFIGLQVPLARQKEAEDLLCREMPYEHNGMKFDVEQKSGPSWDKT